MYTGSQVSSLFAREPGDRVDHSEPRRPSGCRQVVPPRLTWTTPSHTSRPGVGRSSRPSHQDHPEPHSPVGCRQVVPPRLTRTTPSLTGRPGAGRSSRPVSPGPLRAPPAGRVPAGRPIPSHQDHSEPHQPAGCRQVVSPRLTRTTPSLAGRPGAGRSSHPVSPGPLRAPPASRVPAGRLTPSHQDHSEPHRPAGCRQVVPSRLTRTTPSPRRPAGCRQVVPSRLTRTTPSHTSQPGAGRSSHPVSPGPLRAPPVSRVPAGRLTPSHLVQAEAVGGQHLVGLHAARLAVVAEQQRPVDAELGVGRCAQQQTGGRPPERHQHVQRVPLRGGHHVRQRVGATFVGVLQLVHTGGLPLAGHVQLRP